jgi:transcriptional regulator with XRE-family HTH domain
VTRRQVAVSRASGDALAVLGNQIRLARHDRGWTIAEFADRLGVNPRTAGNLEAGLPTVSIGTVFNAAFLVGVDLFGVSGPELARARRVGEETLALLPAKVRKPVAKNRSDDFAF